MRTPRPFASLAATSFVVLTGSSAHSYQEPPAAVEPAQPARSDWLALRPVVGQRIVLKLTVRSSKDGGFTVSAPVTITVKSNEGDDFTLLWVAGKPVLPSGLSAKDAERAKATARRISSQPIELVYTRGTGLRGYKDWEKAREETWNSMRDTIESDSKNSNRDTKWLQEAEKVYMEKARRREDFEHLTLKEIAPYFEGADVRLTPGEQKTDTIARTPDLGQPPTPIESTRTMRCAKVNAARPNLAELVIEIEPTPEELARMSKAVVESYEKRVGRALTPSEAKKVARYYNRRTEWALDREKGWPVSVRTMAETRTGEESTTLEFEWELVEGPTMDSGIKSVAEPKP